MGGWVAALSVLSVIAVMIVPLAALIGNRSRQVFQAQPRQKLGDALRRAYCDRSFHLLVVAFFVNGLTVMFLMNHLPAFIVDRGMSPATAATALFVIPIFNLAGSWISGYLGGRFSMKYLLALLYAARAMVILAFITLPISETSVMVFSAAVGLFWLATQPLTSGIIARLFGTRYLATIFGIVFISHQVGSFFGIWLGGVVFDLTGSYTIFWWAVVVLGLGAALLHLPIKDMPVDPDSPK